MATVPTFEEQLKQIGKFLIDNAESLSKIYPKEDNLTLEVTLHKEDFPVVDINSTAIVFDHNWWDKNHG